MLGWPSTRVTGGSPVALAWNAAPTAQVPPGSKEPVNVSFPVQPEPPSGPVALNWIGPVEGVFVMPGLKVMMPVGAAGVPPQVQNVSPWPAAALPVVARIPTAVGILATTRSEEHTSELQSQSNLVCRLLLEKKKKKKTKSNQLTNTNRHCNTYD